MVGQANSLCFTEICCISDEGCDQVIGCEGLFLARKEMEL